MKSHSLSLLRQVLSHSAAVVMVIAITVPLFFLRPLLSISTAALLYLIPVLVSAVLMGLSPGLLAGFCAFLAFNYFFLTPYYTFTVHESQDFIALVIFFFLAALISQLVGQSRKSLAAAKAREAELTRLYELNRALSGVTGVEEVIRTLAAQTLAAFHAEYVQVKAQRDVPDPNTSITSPLATVTVEVGSSHRCTKLLPVTVPLHTTRHSLGEISLCRAEPLLPVEELLLQTFAAQGAMAVERTQLAQSEARARILEASDRLKSTLLSSVSHELRTPLSTIKAAVTSLMDKDVDWELDARQDLLAAIDEETDHLNHLVGNLLDMTRIEAGAMHPNKQWNIISEIIHRVTAHLYRALGGRPVIVDAPDTLPLAPVDDIQMEQVFHNLFSNSIKYSPPGTPITVRVWAEALHTLHVQVTNQGPQVAPEHLENIFNKFHRLQHAEMVSGTGLGLSICKGIIEAHGGRIWAENRPEGFSFRFSIPLNLEGMPPPVIESEVL